MTEPDLSHTPRRADPVPGDVERLPEGTGRFLLNLRRDHNDNAYILGEVQKAVQAVEGGGSGGEGGLSEDQVNALIMAAIMNAGVLDEVAVQALIDAGMFQSLEQVQAAIAAAGHVTESDVDARVVALRPQAVPVAPLTPSDAGKVLQIISEADPTAMADNPVAIFGDRLEGWWSAANAGDTVLSGGAITQVNDLSGNGRHFTATGAVSRNAGGYWEFATTQSGFYRYLDAFSLLDFSVFARVLVPDANGVSRLFTMRDTDMIADNQILWMEVDAAQTLRFRQNHTTQLTAGGGAVAAGSEATIGIHSVYDPYRERLYKDGAVVEDTGAQTLPRHLALTGQADSLQSVFESTTRILGVGPDYNAGNMGSSPPPVGIYGSNRWQGGLYELVLIEGAITDDEIVALQAWMSGEQPQRRVPEWDFSPAWHLGDELLSPIPTEAATVFQPTSGLFRWAYSLPVGSLDATKSYRLKYNIAGHSDRGGLLHGQTFCLLENTTTPFAANLMGSLNLTGPFLYFWGAANSLAPYPTSLKEIVNYG